MMIDTAVIPCGGLGTRLHYWTLDEVADAGLLRAIIITNPHKPMLEAAARNYPGPLELEFVAQDHPRGLGDALLRVQDNLAGSPFMTLLPDNLFHGSNPTTAVLATYRTTGLATVLLAEIGCTEAGSKGATGRAVVWKAPDAAVTPIGRMAFPGTVLAEFEEVGRGLSRSVELDDVPVLQRLAQREALAGVITTARFFDVGVPEGYRDAVAASPVQA